MNKKKIRWIFIQSTISAWKWLHKTPSFNFLTTDCSKVPIQSINVVKCAFFDGFLEFRQRFHLIKRKISSWIKFHHLEILFKWKRLLAFHQKAVIWWICNYSLSNLQLLAIRLGSINRLTSLDVLCVLLSNSFVMHCHSDDNFPMKIPQNTLGHGNNPHSNKKILSR